MLDIEEMSSVFSPHQLLSILSHSKGLPSAVHTALLASIHAAMRADSANAPSTHAEAAALDAAAGNTLWGDGEEVELDNHGRNGSWELMRRRDVPKGRRIHKMVWRPEGAERRWRRRWVKRAWEKECCGRWPAAEGIGGGRTRRRQAR